MDEEGDRAEARRELEEADQLFFTIGGSFVDMLDAAFKVRARAWEQRPPPFAPAPRLGCAPSPSAHPSDSDPR